MNVVLYESDVAYVFLLMADDFSSVGPGPLCVCK